VIIYSYFLYSFALILTQRKKVVKEEFIPLFIVGILPVIGGILQSVFYGLLMMWSFAGFSLVVVYIFLQQRMVHLDDLTGAWTRGTFEYCLAQRAKRRKDDVFGLVLLDIDGLKKINDEYGHFEGDYALKTIVQLIKSVLKKTDVIARTGGDEFLIILDCNSREKVEHTIEKIKSTLRLHNETSSKDYLLDCSIGAELFHSGFTDIDQFMRHVDKLMYENKRIKKCG
jgi:diguanylate cyclase (GGDEF)-like protein